MPHVPKSLSLSIEPSLSYVGKDTSVDEGYNTDYINNNNNNQNTIMTDYIASVSTRELEQITQTLQVDMMVSDSYSNSNSDENGVHSSPSSSTVTTLQNSDCANSKSRVCGVIIVDERINMRSNQHEWSEPVYKNTLILGSVILAPTSYNGEDIRKSIQNQLSTCVPKNFTFLTKEGWPVLKNQECKLHLTHLINNHHVIAIRKSFDKARVGLINTQGECLGFVFIEYYWSLKQMRETVDVQLKEIGVRQPIKANDYKFIDKNGWPVTTNQESLLTVIDIVVNHNICLQTNISITYNNQITQNVQTNRDRDQLTAMPSVSFSNIDMPNTRPKDLADVVDASLDNVKRRSNRRGLMSFRQTTQRVKEQKKVIKISRNSRALGGNSIMISYARQEAAQHAIDLKKQLVTLGLSVYLDVHEIQHGSDWQDSLNDAVRSCEVFVPLVTPMYGKTQWTNREVKLADIMKKNIIPINFLDQWPPECLAIQFATTQYIHWRPSEGEHEVSTDKSPLDIKNWQPIYIERVSDQVCSRVQALKGSTKKAAIEAPIVDTHEDQIDNRNDKPLIVISAHPQQRHIVAQIKEGLIEEDFNVWASTDLPQGGLLEEDVSYNTPPLASPTALPTINEGKETVFTDRYKDIARKFVENSKRPVSLPGTDNSQVQEIKRSLSRMMSQSDAPANFCSLTPDKMGQLKAFSEQVSSAKLVLVLASETYFKSRTSQQHVYYCERRKRMLLIKSDNSTIPSWFSMLTGSDFEVSVKNPRFIELLRAHIRRTINPLSKVPHDDMHESKMTCLINFMKRNLPVLDTCVYIVGSTKMQNVRSEEICKAIGNELAKVKNVQIVTSGFYGAGDLVAKSFYETRKTTAANSIIPNNSFESSVVHIVPVKDTQDFSNKSKQNADGTFEAMDYGKTIFLGDSVKERESAVARLLNTCILIEGGPGAAHEIQEFIWNDHFVIPIVSTGGAASGQYNVPNKIFDAPCGVSMDDWALLTNPEATPIDVARAIVKIVMALKETIAEHALSRLNIKEKGKSKTKKSIKKKMIEKKKVNIASAVSLNASDQASMNSPEKTLPVIEHMTALRDASDKGNKGKWKRMHRLITFSRNC